MLVLVAWVFAVVTSAVLGKSADQRLAYGLLGLLMVGLLLTAVVLAILGLVEYAGARGRYIQGKSQAVWALVICGLFMVTVAGGVVRSRSHPMGSTSQLPAGTPLVFEELNFKFTAPGKPWARMDAAKVNPAAKLCLLRGAPEVYFIVSADPVGEVNWTAENFADLTLQRMNGLTESLKVQARVPLRIGVLEGRRVEVEASMRGYNFQYLNWFCVTNGWAYQLMAYGRVADRERIIKEGERLMQNFELLDYNRKPPLAGRATVADYVSTNFGYRVQCGSPGWMSWDDLDKDCQYASFGVLHRRDAVLAVAAVWLMDLHPRPEAVYRGMIEVMGIAEGSKAVSQARIIHEQGLDGIETSVDVPLKNGKDYSYRIKILQGNGFAYVVAAWLASSQPGKEQWLSNALAIVDFSSRPDAKPDPTGWDERTKRGHRLALNSIGMQSYREGGFVEAARYFELAAGLGGQPGATPYLGNLVDAYISAGRDGDALVGLERHPDIVAAQPALQAQRAHLQGRLGQVEAAITNYVNLFSSGFSAEDHFREYLGLLAQNNQMDRAMTEIESFVKNHETPSVRVLQAALLKQRKKFDEAIAILKSAREKNPFHAGVAYALGDAYIQAGQPTEALILSEEMIKQQGNSTSMIFLKGRAEFSLKWYRQAKESFGRAQKESPADSDVKSYLEAVSAMLGEGASAIVKEAITPVALPAELLASPPAPPADYARDEGAYYQRAIKAVSFKRGQELKTTDYLTVKTLNAAGVSAFSTFQIAFNPLVEELYVNRLEVRDAGDSLVSTGRVADFYVLDDRSSSAAVSRKVLNLPVSGLQPGCKVELVCTRREFGGASEFTFLPYAFSRGAPAQECVLFLSGDTGAVRFASSPAIEPQPVVGGLCWRQKNPTVVRWEPLMPQVADYAPIVWVGDAKTTWTGAVSNYIESIRERLDLPESQQNIAGTLTAGITNEGDKVAAIAGYVQTNYSYKAIEFGRRARVPQSLTDIVRNKYGDCKDHSVLAQQMLKVVGVPASLALVNVNGPVRRDLPSLDQFDHMLVYIAASAGDRFLDCTVKNSNLAVPWTSGLAGCEALVLDAANPRFIRVSSYPTNASVIRVTRSIELTNVTDAVVREELVFNGIHAGYMRDYLRNTAPEARRAYFAGQILGGAGQLGDLVFEGLEQPQLPLLVRLSYVARGQFHLLEKQIVGTPPVAFERAFLIHEAVEKRISPFEVIVPLTIEGTVTVAITSKFKPKPLDKPSGTTGGEYVSCRISVGVVGNGWRLNYHLHEPAIRRPAAAYGEHCLALQQAVDLLKPRLVGEQVQR